MSAMDAINYLSARGTDTMSHVEASLLYTLLALVIFIALLGTGLIFLRRRQQKLRQQQDLLPRYEESGSPDRPSISKRLSDLVRGSGAIKTDTPIMSEKHCFDSVPSTPSTPCSPIVPEIRVTFPEELDNTGKRQSGRVVVVHMAEQGGVGMEPVEEKLLQYQKDSSDRFHSIDMDRIGGLKEKDSPA